MFDLLIVGGGIGGLFLALLAGRQGKRVILFERRPPPDRGFGTSRRAILLQPNGQTLLDSAGILSDVESLGLTPIQKFHLSDTAGEAFFTVDYETLPPPYNLVYNIPPELLLDLLLRRVGELPNVEVRFNAFLMGLSPGPDGCKIRIAVKGEGEREIEGGMIVGADGVGSAVRQAAGLAAEHRAYPEGYLSALLPIPPEWGSDGRFYLGGGEFLALFPVDPKTILILFMITSSDYPQLRSGPIDPVKERIAAIVSASRDPDISLSLDLIQGWDDLAFTPAVRVSAPCWTTERVALIGDAVHSFNPHIAQGANQALEDAAALADVIARGAPLAEYEAGRRPITDRLLGLGDELAFLWNSKNPLVSWGRTRAFRRVGKNRRLMEKMLRTTAGIDVRPYDLYDRLVLLGLPDFRS